MNKVIMLKVIVGMFLLTSCHLLGKKQVMKEGSSRSLAGLGAGSYSGEYPGGLAGRKNAVPVSKIIVTKNRKPYCFITAKKYPQVLPVGMQVAYNNIQMGLPECNQKDVAYISNVSQKTAYLDEKGRTQVAGAFVPVGLCLVGGALAKYVYRKRNIKKDFLSQVTEDKIKLALNPSSKYYKHDREKGRIDLIYKDTQSFVQKIWNNNNLTTEEKINLGIGVGLVAGPLVVTFSSTVLLMISNIAIVSGVCGGGTYGLIMLYDKFKDSN